MSDFMSGRESLLLYCRTIAELRVNVNEVWTNHCDWLIKNDFLATSTNYSNHLRFELMALANIGSHCVVAEARMLMTLANMSSHCVVAEARSSFTGFIAPRNSGPITSNIFT